ncbi:MAG: hypothetical protein A2135_03065 [Actinobacteria bacterium RBG_16_67_15]|nr:MAG: hypothetical protein A2135_03065 [Actinobacteria bacterium RBG_16_67_15]
MNDRPQAWPAARIALTGALLLFTTTIVIGILNGLDVFSPNHDVLIGHVHAGTLGWITLSLSGMAMLLFTKDRVLGADELAGARRVAMGMTAAITLYVAAFYTADAIPGDRISRPIAGTILLLVVVWFLGWMFRSQRVVPRTVARLGLLLAFISMLIGAVFGIVLGIATSGRDIPGLSADTTNAIADAHPPAMVIGFLLLAALAMIEWLLGDRDAAGNRAGVVQMWLVFAAGVVVNIAFVTKTDEQLLGPANVAMIAAVIMLLVRRRADLKPSAWKGAGTGVFPRMSALFLIGYLVLLTVVVVRFVSGAMDIDAMTPQDDGLLIAFDHTMFIGVMTNALFGALAANLHGKTTAVVDRILLWGISIGVTGFVVGLITVEAVPKRIFTPIMGTTLLIGIAAYLMETRKPATMG